MSKHGRIRMIAVGDVMLGDHPVCIGHGVRSQMEKRGMDYPFQFVSSLLKRGDVTFGNLETVLADVGDDRKSLRNAELRGKAAYCEAIQRAGFSVLSIANNHIMQHGEEAFKETIAGLGVQRIFPVGIRENEGRSNVFVFEKDCIRMALVSYSFRPEKYHEGPRPYAGGDEMIILQHIADLARIHDVVVVSLHWGEEYVNYPSAAQIRNGHRMIDAGAKLILGHHPHVLQGLEEYGGGFVAYSLGNFVFDKWQRNPRESVVLDCVMSKNGIEEISWVPVLINRRYQPELGRGRRWKRIDEKMKKYSAMANVGDLEDRDPYGVRYARVAHRAYLRFRLSSYLYFLIHLHRYSPEMLKQSMWRSIRRRISGLGDK